MNESNVDQATVSSFGDEWTRFDQAGLEQDEARKIFEMYFRTFPWPLIDDKAVGFDMGCGSGRWAYFVAPRVQTLHCIDPSSAIEVAKRRLAPFSNVRFVQRGVSDQPLPEGSQDFGYSLGVLHHIPDTQAALASCARLLKPGAPFLLYLYYAFDNRPFWFRWIWAISDSLRKGISRLPPTPKNAATDCLAAIVYFPLARLAWALERVGLPVDQLPLSAYRHRSWYVMRTDARDRFGTPLEQRFTRQQIEDMMVRAGFRDIVFGDSMPYWCCSGIKSSSDVRKQA